jgi:hypothetical protein
MSRWSTRAVVAFSTLLTIGGQGFASPWGRDTTELLSISRLDVYRAEAAQRRFDQTAAQSYVEFGATDNLTIGGKVVQAWQAAEGDDIETRRTGVIEADVFVQRTIRSTETSAVSLQLLYAAPTRLPTFGVSGGEDGRDAAVQLGALWGRGFGQAFFSSALSYRASLGDDADQIRLDGTIGYNRTRGRLYLLDVYSTYSLGDAGPLGLDYSVMTMAPSVVLPLTQRYKIQFGANVDLATDGIDAGKGLFMGLWYAP